MVGMYYPLKNVKNWGQIEAEKSRSEIDPYL